MDTETCQPWYFAYTRQYILRPRNPYSMCAHLQLPHAPMMNCQHVANAPLKGKTLLCTRASSAVNKYALLYLSQDAASSWLLKPPLPHPETQCIAALPTS